ncbi:hypothetical protein [Streptomyces sp. NBC_01217]|uniref:hypothetical protein n=1 Tax=Streptomyces sp. NBC_01217 TaxID=2903779 RepID=UPI002E0DAC6C|nr:hypothetical protein OG507_00100 [Streptomyces sp. NBC_01217]WSQ62583.1 hypothetical protein OG507_39470 [Streptomyces sp. NBC_01217]
MAAVVTVTTAVTAHAAAAKYAYQELEYVRTASELETLLVLQEDLDGPAEQSQDVLVVRCELIISVQNDAGMAEWITI